MQRADEALPVCGAAQGILSATSNKRGIDETCEPAGKPVLVGARLAVRRRAEPGERRRDREPPARGTPRRRREGRRLPRLRDLQPGRKAGPLALDELASRRHHAAERAGPQDSLRCPGRPRHERQPGGGVLQMRPRSVLSCRPGPRTAGDRMVAGDRLPDLSPHAPGWPGRADQGDPDPAGLLRHHPRDLERQRGLRTPPQRTPLHTPVHLASPATRRRALGGGPRSCPAGVVCSQGGRVTAAWVNSIDLDAQAASYEWIAQATNSVSGLLAEPEIRLDPLRDGVQSGLSKVVSNTFFRGTCGGYLVGSPSLAGEHVLYQRNLFECDGPRTRKSPTASSGFWKNTLKDRPRRRDTG